MSEFPIFLRRDFFSVIGEGDRKIELSFSIWIIVSVVTSINYYLYSILLIFPSIRKTMNVTFIFVKFE